MCPISTHSSFSTPSTALTQNISCTCSRPTVTSSLTTFHEFPIFTASITNKGAAWALLHSLSDSAPPRRVLWDGNDQPLVHSNSLVHSLAWGVSMRFRNCGTVQYRVPFPQLDGATPRDIIEQPCPRFADIQSPEIEAEGQNEHKMCCDAQGRDHPVMG